MSYATDWPSGSQYNGLGCDIVANPGLGVGVGVMFPWAS